MRDFENEPRRWISFRRVVFTIVMRILFITPCRLLYSVHLTRMTLQTEHVLLTFLMSWSRYQVGRRLGASFKNIQVFANIVVEIMVVDIHVL